ncbi:MAG: hypothetical protein RIC95_13495 [Vicingaceae bacterium]
MSRDFTIDKYEEFLQAAMSAGYQLISFKDYLENSYEKCLILRHDVDKKPQNSLKIAKLQKRLGAKGVYYFRAVPQSFDESIIQEIATLGHEIGYHYEDLAICKGNEEMAIEHFEHWLAKLRKLAPVNTICMHGSPLSKYDNRHLWKTYNYRDYDIMAEPYFDLDFKQVFYLTDTGRRWDGDKVSVRDKVQSPFELSFHHTDEIIKAFKEGDMPAFIMQNIHPQRWTNSHFQWGIEYLSQRTKNFIKRQLYVKQ